MQTAERTANAILNIPERFNIRWMGINLRFGIKPLKLGTLIYIGKAASKMGEIIKPDNIMAIIGTANTNAMPMSRVVAYSILNNRTRIKLFGRILARFLLWRLSAKDLITLVQLVIKQSSVTDFFSCTVLVKGISPIKAVEPLKEEKQSGEKSLEQ